LIYLWNSNFKLYFQQLELARHMNSGTEVEGVGLEDLQSTRHL